MIKISKNQRRRKLSGAPQSHKKGLAVLFITIFLLFLCVNLASSAEGDLISNFSLIANNTNPTGITTNGTDIFVSDWQNDMVYRYNLSGTYLSNFTYNTDFKTNSFGITNNGSNLFVIDYIDMDIGRFYMNGTYIDEGNLPGNVAQMRGLANNGTNLFGTSDSDKLIYILDLDDYSYISNFSLSGESTIPTAVASNNNYFWSVDSGSDEVYKYYMNGSYTGSHWDIASSGSSDVYGASTSDGNYLWTIDGVTKLVYQYEIEGTFPSSLSVTLNSPANNSLFLDTSLTFNATLTATNLNLTNATIYIWNSTTEFNITTNILKGNTANSTIWNVFDFDIDDYKWNVFGCGIESNNASNVNCIWAANNFTLINEGINIGNKTFNTTSYETSTESFSINITLIEGATFSSASLIYNGTSYSTTSTSLGSNKYKIERSFDIPLLPISTSQNLSFYWNFEYSKNSVTFIQNSTEDNQTITPLLFGNCNSTLNVPYINFSFIDESDSSVVNGSIPSSTFIYYLGSGIVYKTLNFINNSEFSSYSFCSSPPDRILKVDYEIRYESTGYPQRTVDPSLATFTNTTTNTTLYLLASADGLYVTFQVLNTADQPLDGVVSTAIRILDGLQVGSGTTGADGGVTYWLNPNYQHNFTFDKDGYDYFSTVITPTQSGYTIVLGEATTTNISDYGQGITYSILPVGYLINNTVYNFNFTIASTYWVLDEFGFNITNGSGALFTSNSSTTDMGGIISLDVDTGTNNTFILNFYYIVNGTFVLGTKTYIIIDDSDSAWSIKNLLTRFSSYMSTGIFGLTINGVGIIAFLIVFTVSGALTYKFGLSSPAAIMGFIFGLVLLFDVGLGLLTVPSEIGAVAHFPTILIGVIFLGVFFKEAAR